MGYASKPLSGKLRSRVLAGGTDWRVAEYLCGAGPADRPFEERHGQVTIAAVVAGTFRYHADTGRALMHPGALLLGNAGTCFECGHEHGIGDRCIAIHLAPGYFDEVAAGVAGRSGFRFHAAKLSSAAHLLPWLAHLEAQSAAADPAALEELVPCLAEVAVGLLSGEEPLVVRNAPREARRISGILRLIEKQAGEALSLDALAGLAAMSKYHFLRCFRAQVGTTPYRYLLGVRLHRAAVRLVTSSEPVSAIAYDCGFGDLSTFNARFRRVFGVSPTAWRRRERRA